jgi:predicted O-methyltransferase YrrM
MFGRRKLNRRNVPSSSAEVRKILGAVGARHAELSAILSADDDPGSPTPRLFDVSLGAAQAARTVDMRIFDGRTSNDGRWFDIWPGEHYRLLAGLVKTLKPKVVVEIGTFLGAGALSLAQELEEGAVHTFDVAPWDGFKDTWLNAADFDARLVQHIADLSDPAQLRPHAALLESADLLLVDAPKDGVFEPAFIGGLETLSTKPGLVVVFDDVRVMTMLETWRKIRRPKLDLVSFGHWSGTGLVDWNG